MISFSFHAHIIHKFVPRGSSKIYSTCHQELNWTEVPGYLDAVIFYSNRVLQMSHLTKGLETPGQTWERWPNSSADPAKSHPDDTKWEPALTAHSSLETISPIMHMTCVSGLVSYKGCVMNSLAWWIPHNENALQSCQARCFNGLISEAIIVNTSQWRRLEAQWEEAWNALVLIAYRLICEGRWVMTIKSKWQNPSLWKRRNMGDIILNEITWRTSTSMETTLNRLTSENLNEVDANSRFF